MKPFLRLTAKDFLTGIGPGAHLGTGGLFFKAAGVTPLFEAGSSLSANNGLLMAGASGTTVGGTLNGNILSSTQFTSSSDTKAYFNASDSHIYSLVLDSAISNSFVDAHTAANLRHGLEVYRSSNAGNMLFYFMDTAIGRFNLNATWDDAWTTISTDDVHATHQAFDRIYFGNGIYIGVLSDDGSGLTTSGAGNTAKQAFSIARYGNCTDISDDGQFLVIATTKNASNDPNMLSGCNILFWDTYSSLASRIYSIPDPYIFALEKTARGVFAIGTTGIWQVGYGFEPQKVFSRSTGIYSNQTTSALKYGKGAASSYADALLWGGTSGTSQVVKTFGKLDATAPLSYLQPFLSTPNKNITHVSGQLVKGWVFVGDSTPQVKAYPFSTTNAPQTGVTAQTAYIPVPEKVQVGRIDLIFGEPLTSGDSITAGAFTDEDTTVTAFGTASFASDGATYRKCLYPNTSVTAEDQLSLYLSYDAGAVKIKAVEVYGTDETP